MPQRHLPVRPDLRQLKHQAKDLLRAARAGDPHAADDFAAFHPGGCVPAEARLADAQLVLARAYQAPSWPRLVTACRLAEAIWGDDVETVRRLVTRRPGLLHENVLIRESNWGPPLSYAANLGRDEIIAALLEAGSSDLGRAMNRAVLQGEVETARKLHRAAGSPPPPPDALRDPAYTLNVEGTAFILEIGAQVTGDDGRRLAPVETVLGTDSRRPAAKHAILEMYVRHGFELPDTPTMALHRGRIDLLEQHLDRDPGLLNRQFAFAEIYPPELGCSQKESVGRDGAPASGEVLMTYGTPLNGATLLHMCADFDEIDLARWLIGRGADVNARAAIDADGFGGHTPLFSTVVAQPNFWMNRGERSWNAEFAALFLEHGADPNARASLRKQLHPGYGDHTIYELRDVTPLSWGRRFPRGEFVSEPALELIEAAGGRL
jgi:ankyrin repeat protein